MRGRGHVGNIILITCMWVIHRNGPWGLQCWARAVAPSASSSSISSAAGDTSTSGHTTKHLSASPDSFLMAQSMRFYPRWFRRQPYPNMVAASTARSFIRQARNLSPIPPLAVELSHSRGECCLDAKGQRWGRKRSCSGRTDGDSIFAMWYQNNLHETIIGFMRSQAGRVV